MFSIEKQFRRIQTIISQPRMYYMKAVGSRRMRQFVPTEYVEFWRNAQSNTQVQARNLSEKCMICLLHMDEQTERLWTCAVCKKAFHHECIGTWVHSCRQHNGSPTCPNCRQAITHFDKTLRHSSSDRLHARLYNLAENTVTINGRVYDIHVETLADKLIAIHKMLDQILQKASLADSVILEQLKTYLDDNGIDSTNVQEKIDSFNSPGCCIS
jgi:hypothetical protein